MNPFRTIKSWFARKEGENDSWESAPPNTDAGSFTEAFAEDATEFFGEGTEAEFIEQKRKDEGLEAWYKRILR